MGSGSENVQGSLISDISDRTHFLNDDHVDALMQDI